MVGVAASGFHGNRTWYSNYGRGTDLLAPGGDLTADRNSDGIKDGILFETLDVQESGDYTDFQFALGQGTSFAAPHVSATLAMMVPLGTIWPEVLERFIKMDLLNVPAALGKIMVIPPHPDDILLRAEGEQTVYYLDGGKLKSVHSALIYRERFGSWDKIVVDDPYTISTYPKEGRVGFPDGTLLIRSSDKTIYVLEDGKKRSVGSWSNFKALGYRLGNVLEVSDDELSFYPNGEVISSTVVHPDGSLVKTAYSPVVYLTADGKKHHLRSAAVFRSHGFEWSDIVVISTEEMSSYPLGEMMNFANGSVLKGSVPTIYLVTGGNKRPFSSAETYLDLGFKWSSYRTVSDLILGAFSSGSVIP